MQIESVRLLFVLALRLNLRCRHVDFTTAFLNGVLDTDVYMEQPLKFDDGSDRVCLLKRALYGLKQSPRIWNQTLSTKLIQLGFKQCRVNAGVYCATMNDSLVFLSVYVDNILIAATDTNTTAVISALRNEYDLKDLGDVRHLLGMEVHQTSSMITISQQAYVERLVERFDQHGAHPVRTPMQEKCKLVKASPDDDDVNDPSLPY